MRLRGFVEAVADLDERLGAVDVDCLASAVDHIDRVVIEIAVDLLLVWSVSDDFQVMAEDAAEIDGKACSPISKLTALAGLAGQRADALSVRHDEFGGGVGCVRHELQVGLSGLHKQLDCGGYAHIDSLQAIFENK